MPKLVENAERPHTPLSGGAPLLTTVEFQGEVLRSLGAFGGVSSEHVLRLVFAGIVRENGNGVTTQEAAVDRIMHELFGSQIREGRPRSDMSDATLLLTDRYIYQAEQREVWSRLPDAERSTSPAPKGKSIEDLAREVVQEVYEYERDADFKNEDSLVRAVGERFYKDKEALIRDFAANARFETDTRRVAQVLLGLVEGMSVCVDFGVTRQLRLVSAAARSS